MTDLLTPPQESGTKQGSMVLSAVAAALWAAGVGLVAITVAVLLTWAADSRSGADAGAVLRIAADGWLLANGSALQVAGSPLSLVPLGLAVLPAYLLGRAGTSLARTVSVVDTAGALRLTAALALAYGVLAVVAAGAAATPQVSAPLLRAFVAATALAAVCGGIGVMRGAGRWHHLWAWLPAMVRAGIQGGALAVAVVLAGAAVLAGTSLALSAGEAGQVLNGLGVGAVGALALLLLSLSYLPNALVYAAAFLTGSGFAVGAGTAVSPFEVRLGPVPALPLLAALPSGSGSGWLAVMAAPVAGGLLGGVMIGGQHRAAPLRWLLPTAAATGPAAGLMLGLLCLLASGAAGSDRLATVGPSAWRVAVVLAVEVAPVAVAAAWWTARRDRGERLTPQVL